MRKWNCWKNESDGKHICLRVVERDDQIRCIVFKNRKCPPQHKDLIALENDLFKLFRDRLRKDIMSIKKSKNIYIFTGKTNNLYETAINSYNKLLTEKISKTYRKTNNKAYLNSINKEDKAIDRWGVWNWRQSRLLVITNAFITLKDYKKNFRSNPKCRLKIPAKNELAKLVNYLLKI